MADSLNMVKALLICSEFDRNEIKGLTFQHARKDRGFKAPFPHLASDIQKLHSNEKKKKRHGLGSNRNKIIHRKLRAVIGFTSSGQRAFTLFRSSILIQRRASENLVQVQ